MLRLEPSGPRKRGTEISRFAVRYRLPARRASSSWVCEWSLDSASLRVDSFHSSLDAKSCRQPGTQPAGLASSRNLRLAAKASIQGNLDRELGKPYSDVRSRPNQSPTGIDWKLSIVLKPGKSPGTGYAFGESSECCTLVAGHHSPAFRHYPIQLAAGHPLAMPLGAP